MFVTDEDLAAKFVEVPKTFASWMAGRLDVSRATIADFGCDFGLISLGLAVNAGCGRVIGIEINDHHEQLLSAVGERLSMKSLPGNLEFRVVRAEDALAGTLDVDCIFSWSVFEHIDQRLLDGIVADHFRALPRKGFEFVQIAPLYYSAYGSHLDSILDKPWAHLSMQHNLLEAAVLDEPAELSRAHEEHGRVATPELRAALWSCYRTLNRLTAADLIDVFERKGFRTVRKYLAPCEPDPPPNLCKTYSRDVLKTEQIVALFQKP